MIRIKNYGAKIILMALILMNLSVPAGAQNNFLAQFDPTGIWEADDHESRYDVTLCGDGSQICAKLVWIQPDKINDRNIQYLNKYVIYQANRATPGEWRGQIDIYGTKVGGSMKIHDQNTIKVVGCAFYVLCQGFSLDRIS